MIVCILTILTILESDKIFSMAKHILCYSFDITSISLKFLFLTLKYDVQDSHSAVTTVKVMIKKSFMFYFNFWTDVSIIQLS